MDDKWRKASDYVDKWVETGDDLGETNWRSEVMERMAEGDIEGMKEAAAPSLQWNLIKLAHESSSEQLRLQALQFALGQGGHGVVQKVDKRVSYEQLPSDQLLSVLRSKLAKLEELVPNFSAEKLLEGVVVEADVEIDPAPVIAESSNIIDSGEDDS